MSRYLHLDMRNAVKVGTTTLPGILTGLSVNGALEVMQDQFEGSSTHLTSIKGFTTATVGLEITLVGTDTEREHQLRLINKVFMVSAADEGTGGTAQSWRVVNPHLDARRIRQMLFTKFDSRDGNDDDSTTVSLEFKEILSEQARLEKAAQQDSATDAQTGTVEMPGVAADGATPGAGAQTPPPPLSPFQQGLADGRSVVTPPAQTIGPPLPTPAQQTPSPKPAGAT